MKRGFHRYLVFITLAIVQVGGTLALFSSYLLLFHRNQVQKEIQTVDETTLEYLDFSAESFKRIQWTEEGREFERRGMRYDVARIEKTAGGYRVIAKRDIFEVLLEKFLDEPDNPASGGLTLQLTFAQHEAPVTVLKILDTPTRCYGDLLSSLYHSFAGDCLTPPPRG